MWHQNDSSKHFGFVLLIKESAEIAIFKPLYTKMT